MMQIKSSSKVHGITSPPKKGPLRLRFQGPGGVQRIRKIRESFDFQRKVEKVQAVLLVGQGQAGVSSRAGQGAEAEGGTPRPRRGSVPSTGTSLPPSGPQAPCPSYKSLDSLGPCPPHGGRHGVKRDSSTPAVLWKE